MSLITQRRKGGDPERVLLLVHGLGADERDLGGLLPYLDPDGRFVTVLPRGPVAAPPGFAWYDIGGVAGARDRRRRSRRRSTRSTTCSTRRAPSTGSPRDEAMVGGFSQGAGLAARARRCARATEPHPSASSR